MQNALLLPQAKKMGSGYQDGPGSSWFWSIEGLSVSNLLPVLMGKELQGS